ncbi:MAG TPA: alkaline phosphatase D family protein [Actinomycetota bacterium]|nr:alkaline phosphatase D family protein [Actinomycetota bacterium]
MTPERRTLFSHSVASGEPTASGVVLWTRAAGDADVDLVWEVADDEGFRNVVASGTAAASPTHDGCVRVIVDGLDAGSTYHYRFSAGDDVSPTGRTRTLPVAPVEHVRFAIFSCAKYSAGYFNALGRIADRNDIDFVVCLGDYIYEYGNDDPGLGAEIGRAFDPPHRCYDLADYRTRYAQSRSDPDMRRMHERHPIVALPDDHEFADNTWRGGAKKHDDAHDGDWRKRFREAFQAWTEWIPSRVEADADEIRLFRHLELGDLADLILLDTRTRRDRQAQGREVEDEDRTLLGRDQFEWLTDRLTGSSATWRLIGQQVMIAQVDSDLLPEDLGDPLGELGILTERDHGPEPDQWDGYPAERRRLLHDVTDHGVRDVVFLSGDVHSAWACDLRLDPHDGDDAIVAVEFCTTSVTSENLDDHTGWGYRTRSPAVERELIDANPHIHWAEVDSHGYMLVDVTPERVETQWHFVDTLLHPSDGVRLGGAWQVRRGTHTLEPVERPSDRSPASIGGEGRSPWPT